VAFIKFSDIFFFCFFFFDGGTTSDGVVGMSALTAGVACSIFPSLSLSLSLSPSPPPSYYYFMLWAKNYFAYRAAAAPCCHKMMLLTGGQAVY